MIDKIKNLYKKYNEIIMYLIIGGLTTLINIFAYFLVTHAFLNPKDKLELQIAEVIAWIIAVIFAYYTNKKYVFKVKRNKTLKEALSFFSSRIVTLLIEMVIMYIFVSLLNFDDKIIKIIAQIIVIILNYVFSKFIVFKKEKWLLGKQIAGHCRTKVDLFIMEFLWR